ncbi:hypothetical protein ROA7450_00078 [Roseovarius albus]|uniref:UDP-N-acetylmuramate--alanine ligase n=1 Tax=Roseovarius albus TaxID=1247867 RepID=A0A1X6Y5L7_9RHOB|nr:DUF2484 family protein [Roseovarius albus]SLN11246.1 hypothetical protein ROA7450_00078 [Roseovarius albus]
MSISLTLSCIWVLLATLVAFLPMRHQYRPGFALLIAAPVLIVWLGYDYGWVWSVMAVLAFVSMFRNPLSYCWRKWRGTV